MNILLTCAGCRNYLVSYFRDALRPGGLVFAADADRYAPALSEADRGFVVPSISDPAYERVLVELCRDNGVDLVVSLSDLELPLLARRRSQFSAIGTFLLVSSAEVVDICSDKWRTVTFCREHDIGTPATYLDLDEVKRAVGNGELDYPLVVKPRWGSASFGIEYVHTDDELKMAYELVQNRLSRAGPTHFCSPDSEFPVVVQERLRGQEYGLDVVNDLKGRHRAVFARRKTGMRAGETDRAATVDDPDLTLIGQRIGESLKHIGNLDCDVFVSGSSIRLLDMNPRFGGGYPFSHVAGANLPAAIVAWARGEEANPEWLKARPGVVSAKCVRLVEVGTETERRG